MFSPIGAVDRLTEAQKNAAAAAARQALRAMYAQQDARNTTGDVTDTLPQQGAVEQAASQSDIETRGNASRRVLQVGQVADQRIHRRCLNL